jgi:hypothetical protein
MTKKNLSMKYIILGTGLFFCNISQAQTAEDSVKAVVTKLFEAMRLSDTTMFKDCFSGNAILQTIGKNGKVRTEQLAEFIQQVNTFPKNAADERIRFKTILIDGDLAVVWTPYRFYYNNNFSHCGVNSFQLVRFNGNWKVQYIIDTRRKENCAD